MTRIRTMVMTLQYPLRLNIVQILNERGGGGVLRLLTVSSSKINLFIMENL